MRLRRALLVPLVAAVALGANAAPAWAHDLGGRQPTDIAARVVSIAPAVPGLSVQVVDLGQRLELRNRTNRDVVVLGYDGEPYLRVGPDGAFENERSPAVFLNKTLEPSAKVPRQYDAAAPPEWHRLSSSAVVRWHDHRAHAHRAQVAHGPMLWRIPMQYGATQVVVSGRSTWVDPGAWWPWVLLAAAIAVGVALAARRAFRPVVSLTLLAMMIGGVVHLAAGWSGAANSIPSRLGAIAIPTLGLAFAVVALAKLTHDDESAAAPWALLAAMVLFIGLGLGDVLDLLRSQLPSTLSTNVVRALVVLQLGGGIGTAVAAAGRLRPRATDAPQTPAAVTIASVRNPASSPISKP